MTDRNEQGIVVVGEVFQDRLEPVTFEVLRVARDLSARGAGQVTLLVGGVSLPPGELQQALTHGAHRVFSLEHPVFSTHDVRAIATLFNQFLTEHSPAIILAAATTWGTTLMPYLAVKLRTGLTADCTHFELDPTDESLLQVRPAIGGNILATIKTRTRPQMATVRPNTFRPLVYDDISGEIVVQKVTSDSAPAFLQERFHPAEVREDLSQAHCIVAGGRGLKSAHRFDLVKQLASILKASVGASRSAVEQGWIPYLHQVGLSGKTVSPRAYLALGISGAIQHLAGMQSAQHIIAVNRDPEAPIFRVADFGVVGDVQDIVPCLIQLLEEPPR